MRRRWSGSAWLAGVHWAGVGATLLFFLAGVAAALLQKDPAPLLQAGVVTLVLTPLTGVLFALMGFILQRETAMVLVGLALAGILLVSYWLGGV